MSLTGRQKDIIRDIYNKKVYNLESFAEKYYEDKTFFIDVREVQKKKNEDYEMVKKNIENIMNQFDKLMKESGTQLKLKIIKE